MVGSFVRFAAAAAFSAFLAGCVGSSDRDRSFEGGSVATPDTPLQCVPYARSRSQIALRGDAYTWWDQAAGRYARNAAPSEGSVMVLYGYAGPNRAHLAVVREIVGARDIRVDHANWLDDGAIYEDDPVRDVSADNDWTQVRVYNLKAGAWGSRIYPVQGFIGPGGADDEPLRLAQSSTPKASESDSDQRRDNDPIADLIDDDK
jgi:surface antigen